MTHAESFKNGLWVHSPAVLDVPPDACFYRTAPGRYAFGDATSPSTYVAANRGLEIAVGVALPAFSAVAAGLTVNMRTQSAGGVGPSAGGDLILLTGSGAGAAGRRGYFNVTGSSAGLRTTMIGENAGSFSAGADCTFLGYNAGAAAAPFVGINATFIGSGAGAAATGDNNTAVGYNAGIAAALIQNTLLGSTLTVAGGSTNVAVGFNTAVTGGSNVVVGPTSLVTGSGNVAVGVSTNVVASNATLVGCATSAGAGSIALGYAAAAGAGVAVMGSNGFPIGILYGGKGETNAAATAWAVSGTGGTTGGGGNSPGADLELRGGPGTGTGAGGHVLIRNAPFGLAGIAPNPPVTHLDFDQFGLAVHTPSVSTGTVPPEWTLTAAAHTALTAGTFRYDVYYDLGRVVQWANGDFAMQDFFHIQHPTVDFVGPGLSTITTAATFAVSAAPQVAGGGRAAITYSYAGLFGGPVYMTDSQAPFQSVFLEMDDGRSSAVSRANHGRLIYDVPTQRFRVSYNGAAYVDLTTGAMAAPGGVNTNVQYNNAGAFGGNAAFTFTAASGTVTLTQPVVNGGTPNLLVATGGAHTALTETEATDIYFNLNRTVQFSGAAGFALQRAVNITAPTYAFTAGGAPPYTIATAATVYVAGAPAAGTNAVITQSYGIYQAAGNSYFGGALNLNSAGGAAVSPAGEGRIRYNNGTSAFEVSISGAAYVALATGAPVGPGGADSEIQYNNGGAFGGSPALTYDDGGGNLWLTFNTGLRTKASADPGAWTAAANTSGTTVYARTQSGGVDGGANPNGANLVFITGAKGAGGNGRAGYFNITNSAAGANTTFLGEDAGNLTTGVDNVCFGYRAGYVLTSGTSSVALGSQALYGESANAITGSNNVAIGYQAMYANAATAHSFNNCVAVGYQAGLSLTTGSFNVMIGSAAGDSLTTGGRNILIGQTAGGALVTTSNNVAIGYGAGILNTENENLYIGSDAGGTNTTGTGQVFVGFQAGYGATGNNNVYMGYQAGDGTSAATNNVGIGTAALGANSVGSNNTAVGYNAGLLLGSGANNVLLGSTAGDALTTGAQNVAIGASALSAISTGSNCVAVGYQAGLVATGAANILIGYQAGVAVTTGTQNVVIGASAGIVGNYDYCTIVGYNACQAGGVSESTAFGHATLYSNTAGAGNAAFGYKASYYTTGGANTSLGYQANQFMTVGTYNTAVGYSANGGNTTRDHTGSNNVCVGAYAGYASTTAANHTFAGCTFIGVNAGYRAYTGSENIAIGKDALTGAAAGITGVSNVCIGNGAMIGVTGGSHNCIIGYVAGDAITSGGANVAVGSDALGAITTNGSAVAIGYHAGLVHTGGYSIYIGREAGYTMTSGTGNIHLGMTTVGSSITASNEFVAGSDSYPINNVYFGKGAVNATPTAYTINGTGGTGTDIAGGALQLAGGIGTSLGNGGSIIFKVAPDAAATGSVANTLQTVVTIDQRGNQTWTQQASIAYTVPEGNVPTFLTLTGAANVALTTLTEVPDVYINLAQTKTWVNGNITSQRAIKIAAPSYAMTSGAPGGTITNAATFYIDREPQAANATIAITNAYALWVDAGKARFDGGLLHPYNVLSYADESSPVTVNDFDSNTVYTNETANAQLIFNLPTAVAGLTYTFIVQAAYNLRVLASAGDTVRLAATVSAAAGYCEAATVGNVVKLVAINATEWIAVSIVGSWTVV